MTEKRINEVNLRIGDSLFLELSKMAVIENRPLADLMFHILERHVYGNRIPSLCEYEENSRGYEGRVGSIVREAV